MHIARYALDECVHYGVIENETTIVRLEGSPLDGLKRSGAIDALAAVRLLSPIERPRVFGLGYNYTAHSNEVGKAVPQLPVLFMKPSTTVIGPNESIVYPDDGQNIHFEGELTVVIGKQARHVSPANALDHVLGYTCGNDVSDRVLQRRESEFGCLLAGKGYDTFAPMGPVIATGLDPSRLGIITRVNGAVRQDGTTADLLFSVPAIVSYLSRYMTLLPGDMIMTGTPRASARSRWATPSKSRSRALASCATMSWRRIAATRRVRSERPVPRSDRSWFGLVIAVTQRRRMTQRTLSAIQRRMKSATSRLFLSCIIMCELPLMPTSGSRTRLALPASRRLIRSTTALRAS